MLAASPCDLRSELRARRGRGGAWVAGSAGCSAARRGGRGRPRAALFSGGIGRRDWALEKVRIERWSAKWIFVPELKARVRF